MNSGNVKVGIGKLGHHVNRSQTKMLIKGGKIVNDDGVLEADIFIEGEVIKEIGTNMQIPGGVKIIEAGGKLILPGGVDTSTHLQMSFMGLVSADDFYSGTKAAIAGGTTTIIDCVTATRGNSILKAYEQYRENADSQVCCDYALHVTVPQFDKTVSDEMATLVKDKGVNSFKAHMAYPNQLQLDDVELLGFFKRCTELGALPLVHAENGKIIEELANSLFAQGIHGPEGHALSHPPQVEIEATQRAISLAAIANSPVYFTSVMSKAAAELISNARREGGVVYGEAMVAALACNGEEYFASSWLHAASHVTSPPLSRERNHGEQQLALLENGDLACVASNHCPFRADQRAQGKDDFRKIPHGVNGVEDRMSVLWELGVTKGLIDASKFVAITSSNAAKLFNLYPRKGRIAVGSDADLVIWDPQATRTISAQTHQQKVDFNVFENRVCHGVVCTVITRGHIVLEDGQLQVSQGMGKYLALPAAAPHIFDRIHARQKHLQPKPVVRGEYDGPTAKEAVAAKPAAGAVVEVNGQGDKENATAQQRPPTRSGGRNLQDSTFSIGGYGAATEQEQHASRPAIRAMHPPGGASSSLW